MGKIDRAEAKKRFQARVGLPYAKKPQNYPRRGRTFQNERDWIEWKKKNNALEQK